MVDKRAEQIGKGCGAIFGLIIILFLGYALVTGLLSSGKDNTTPSTSDMTTFAKGEADLATAMKDPKKVKLMECAGVKVYQDPQPVGHPPSPDECAQIEKQAGIPVAPISSKAESNLTALIPTCDSQSGTDCTQDIYQKVWIRLEADNGEVTKADMKSVQHYNNGAVDVAVYTYVPNTPFNPGKMKRLHFDCQGQFTDDSDGISAVMDAPPRSIAGQIAAVVCKN